MKTPSRIDRLRELLRQKHLESAILYSRENTRYFTAFTGSESSALITAKTCHILVDSRYITQAKAQCAGFEVVDSTLLGLNALSGLLDKMDISTAGVEDEELPLSIYRKYESNSPDVRFSPLESSLSNLRAQKDDGELSLIATAVRIADEAFEDALAFIRPGVSERAAALELETAMRRRGAEKPSFDTIIASRSEERRVG